MDAQTRLLKQDVLIEDLRLRIDAKSAIIRRQEDTIEQLHAERLEIAKLMGKLAEVIRKEN